MVGTYIVNGVLFLCGPVLHCMFYDMVMWKENSDEVIDQTSRHVGVSSTQY